MSPGTKVMLHDLNAGWDLLEFVDGSVSGGIASEIPSALNPIAALTNPVDTRVFSRPYPWEGGWKDTVLLKDGETVDVLIRFDSGFIGRYMLHRHKLEHEDMGMMATFVVVQ